MEKSTTAEVPLRNPRSFIQAKVDAAGRVKLPAKVLEFLSRLADKNLFVTRLKGMARIYTNDSWEHNLNRLNHDASLRRAVATEADKYGAEVELDPQGRITLPQLLRKEMGLEDKPIYVRFDSDVLFLYTQEQYESHTDEARRKLEEEGGYELAEKAGFI